MSTSFTSDFFAGNRRRLRELFTGTAPIVLAANGLMQRGADMAFPFAQDASFWYFTGCDEPDVVLVLDRDKEYLIVPERDTTRVAFDGEVDEARIAERAGIELVYGEKQGWKKLGSRLEKAKHVATLPPAPSYIDRLGVYSNPARRRLIDQMKGHNETIELLDLSEHITRLRMIKQPPEITAIQAAIDITAAGLKQVLRPSKLRGYYYEYEIEAELTRAFRKSGAQGSAFPSIIASGKRACVLHNERNDGPLTPGDLLLCDVGAEVEHYCADITRTVAIGTPNSRHTEVYEAVQATLEYATSQLRPGVLLKEYERLVENFIGEKMRSLGLIKTIDSASVRVYYPHSTSHFLGLNPHDVGMYDTPLEAGMVLTVEPGIYIPSEAIGVRIEDDVLITDDGNQLLTGALPHDLA